MDLANLLHRLFGQPVEPAGFVTLKGDASSRKYHRVTLPPGREPRSLVVMELPDDAMGSDEATAGAPPDELPFLNAARFLAERGLPIPEILLDAVDEGAVLLEDLGDVTFADRVAGVDPAEMAAWYRAAVELLHRMHASLWPIPAGCQAAGRRFDFELLRWELDHYREWGLEALFGAALAPELRQRLDRAFDELAREIAELPQGLVHRDYQSRNLMVRGDEPAPGSMTIIDFQDLMSGPRVYDLVALLNDSYVDVPFDLQAEIIGRYADRAGIDAVELGREFDLATVQRKLKDGGRFVFIDRVKGDPSFLPWVDGSFARVRRSLDRLPGHDELKAVLAAVDPARFG